MGPLVATQAAFLFCVCGHVRNKARNADMEARKPSLPEGMSGMHAADKEWRVEHITGRLFRNDAVVDAVPFVYGVPVVAGSASRVGLDRACVATLRNTGTREIHT